MIRQSLLFSGLGRYGAVGIQIVATVILARLLTPEEIGLFSISFAAISLAHTLRDFGLTAYIIQEAQLTGVRMRSALGLALAVSWTLGGSLFLLRDTLAWLLGDPAVGLVVTILSLNFLLVPFVSITGALFQRDMRFLEIGIIGIGGALAQNVTAIVLAAGGAGVISLAWGNVAGIVASAVISYCCRPAMMPFLPHWREMRRVLRFSTSMSAAAVLVEIGSTGTDVVVGRFVGYGQLGHFSRATGLVQLFHQVVMDVVNPITMPTFSRLHREKKDLRGAYLISVTYITALGFPFFGFLFLWSETIVLMLYGDQWGTAAMIVRILCIGAMLHLPLAFSDKLLISVGQPSANLRMQVLFQSTKLAMISAMVPFGLWQIAGAHAAAFAILYAIAMPLLTRHVGIRFVDIATASAPSLAVSAVALVPAALIVWSVPAEEAHVLGLLGAMPATAAAWLAALYLTRHPIWSEVPLARAALARILARPVPLP